jgi:hypothetical protein
MQVLGYTAFAWYQIWYRTMPESLIHVPDMGQDALSLSGMFANVGSLGGTSASIPKVASGPPRARGTGQDGLGNWLGAPLEWLTVLPAACRAICGPNRRPWWVALWIVSVATAGTSSGHRHYANPD